MSNSWEKPVWSSMRIIAPLAVAGSVENWNLLGLWSLYCTADFILYMHPFSYSWLAITWNATCSNVRNGTNTHDTQSIASVGSFGQHFQRLTSSEQIFHIKLVHDHLPLGNRRHQISQSKEVALRVCPCCAVAQEAGLSTTSASMPSKFLQDTGLTDYTSFSYSRQSTSAPLHFCWWYHSSDCQWKLKFRMERDAYPSHMKDAIACILSEEEREHRMG